MTYPFKLFLTTIAVFFVTGLLCYGVANADEYVCNGYSISETPREYIIACDRSGATDDCVNYAFDSAVPTEQGTALKYCETPQESDTGEMYQRCLYTFRGQIAGEMSVDGKLVARGALPCVKDTSA
jgi:hypothetical protein